MLRKNSLFIKLIKTKKSSFSIFQSFMALFRPELETCPICRQRSMHIHCYYGRTIIDFRNGHPEKSTVTVMRLACQSCGHTHAALPDVIVPYSSHSLFFILRVLAEYFFHLHSVMRLCERFQISVKRLYEWIRLFESQKEQWLGVLESAAVPSRFFLTKLMRQDKFSSFTSDYYRMAARSFLQTHANPRLTDPKAASYCQSVFDPDYPVSMTT